MNKWILSLISILSLTGCQDESTPRPFGYMRIDLPSKKYESLAIDCPYTFEVNKNAEWVPSNRGYCWGDVSYPSIQAQIQLTYKEVDEENLAELLNEAHELAYKHTVRADGIQDQVFKNEDDRVFGLLYRMKGQAATTTQFFLTDSTNHFLRGVVYFYANPNPDSLKPVDAFMANEVTKLIESTRWKNK